MIKKLFPCLTALALSLIITFSSYGQSVIINEAVNEISKNGEWVEIFTTETVDLRGFQLRDFSGSGSAQDPLVFDDVDFWSSVDAGVIILITGEDVALGEDLDQDDGALIVKSSNSSLFSGSQFSLAGNSDAIQILNSDSSHVHGISYGSANSSSLPSSSAHLSTSLDVSESIGFFATNNLSDFKTSFFAKTFEAPTPALGNDADNANFISDIFLSGKDIPRLLVTSGDNVKENEDRLLFSRLGETKSINLENNGSDTLFITDIIVSGDGFSISYDDSKNILLSDENLSVEITFTPPIDDTDQIFSGTVSVSSNAAENSEFIINLASRPELTNEDTFELVTWNIEWFGSTNNGPSNEDLQLRNAARVMQNMDADMYLLQEITSSSALQELTDRLDGYRSFIADHISISLKTAYIYKTSTIDSISAGAVTLFQDRNDWAQRLPFRFRFSFEVGDVVQNIIAVNIHAKANTGGFSDREESYQKRVRAAEDLERYISDRQSDSYVIIAGDYNDDMDVSIFDNRETPYDDFLENERSFRVLTKELTDAGEQSTVGFSSMIDHITITDELFDTFIVGSQEVFDADQLISDYGNTTSDHFPVWAKFDFTGGLVSNEEIPANDLPNSIRLKQNFPNPFNPSTTISFELNRNARINLEIFDILGRQISSPIRNRQFSAGSHQVTFEADNLSSGVYVYRLSVDNGPSVTRKMTLIK